LECLVDRTIRVFLVKKFPRYVMSDIEPDEKARLAAIWCVNVGVMAGAEIQVVPSHLSAQPYTTQRDRQHMMRKWLDTAVEKERTIHIFSQYPANSREISSASTGMILSVSDLGR
jgi:hypothetical protein